MEDLKMREQNMSPEDAEKKLKAFIEQNFLYGESFDLAEDLSLLEQGIMNSTGVLQLVAFLEREFHITVRDEELVPENLDSVRSIIGFLERKLVAAS